MCRRGKLVLRLTKGHCSAKLNDTENFHGIACTVQTVTLAQQKFLLYFRPLSLDHAVLSYSTTHACSSGSIMVHSHGS